MWRRDDAPRERGRTAQRPEVSTRANGGPAVITSARNPAVVRARELERRKAARDAERLYVAWGLHLVQEAIAAQAPITEAFVGPGLTASDEGRLVLRSLERSGCRLWRASPRVLDAIADGCGDQGVLLIVRRPAHEVASIMAAKPDLLLLPHGVQDPGNLGSLVRSALALGSRGLVALDGCADPFSGRAVRAAMGATFRLPVATAAADEALSACRAAGVQVVAADLSGEAVPPDVDLTRPTALLVGNEGAGLPERLRRVADHRVRIPMAGGASSLNVHAAAVALLYETARQRGFR
jgi:TrmH family RNA methyltransferase